MLPKRWVIGLGAIVLVLGSLLGVACDDDEDENGNGAEQPTATEPAGDDTPEAIP